MCQEKHLYLINANLKCKQRGIELFTDNDLHINLKIITLYIKAKTSYIESIISKPVTPSILCNFYNMDTSVKRTLVSVPLMSVLKTFDYNASSVFMMFFFVLLLLLPVGHENMAMGNSGKLNMSNSKTT